MKKKVSGTLIGIILFLGLAFVSIPTIGINIENNKIFFDEPIEEKPVFWTYKRPKNSDYQQTFESIPMRNLSDPPSSFDLREYNNNNYVTTVKWQKGGTCWAHAVLACMESNLLMNGNWEKANETGEPNLAEYHLDWWNGFNTFNNNDVPESSGLPPHQGAYCRIAAAYFARGDGAVYSEEANIGSYDTSWYNTAPDLFNESYHLYYPRQIEIYDVGDNLENIDLIKTKIMSQGPINIVFLIDSKYLRDDYTSYQPPYTSDSPNHNVAIVGWDDNKDTDAPYDGAWLCKNSWGDDWGLDGYFWISYYDKYCCHPYDGNEWTASFQQVEPMPYKWIYYHDYHGWQEDFTKSNEVFNAFTARNDEILSAVNFFTCVNDVEYKIKIYDTFEHGMLQDEIANASGIIDFKGFHTVELTKRVQLKANDNFYIYLKLSNGGIPYDTTTNVWGNIIQSISNPGESYYYDGGTWKDLYSYDSSANFCIKGLVPKTSDLDCQNSINWEKITPGDTIVSNLSIQNIGESFSKLDWQITEYPSWGKWSFSMDNGSGLIPEQGVYNITVTVESPIDQKSEFSGEIRVINQHDPDDYEIISVTLTTPKNTAINNLLLYFFENHPLLRQLMGY